MYSVIIGAYNPIYVDLKLYLAKRYKKAYAKRKLSAKRKKTGIVIHKLRDEDLNTIYKKIFDDMVSDRLSSEQFDKLPCEYQTGQKNIIDCQVLFFQILFDISTQKQYAFSIAPLISVIVYCHRKINCQYPKWFVCIIVVNSISKRTVHKWFKFTHNSFMLTPSYPNMAVKFFNSTAIIFFLLYYLSIIWFPLHLFRLLFMVIFRCSKISK